jgi:4-amino-4-deoxy-L-arabinose transferase-like glycosyltransferase
MLEAVSNPVRVASSRMSETFYGPNGRVWVALFLVALGFLLASFLPTINLPWVEEDDYYGALYSQAAHNNLRAGLCVTGGVPVTLYFGPLPIPRDAYYVHHPVLMPLMVTAAVAIFGEREWSVKLVPILCSVASALFLWLLVRDAMRRRAAALVTAFFVTLPMELHYGDMVDFEPPILTLMLAALVCLRYWHVRGTNVWIVLAGFCCGGAMWTDWPGYLFVLSISIWLLLRKERSARFFGIALLAIAAASGTLFLLQIRHVNPGSWRDLWTAVTMRLGNGVAAGHRRSIRPRSCISRLVNGCDESFRVSVKITFPGRGDLFYWERFSSCAIGNCRTGAGSDGLSCKWRRREFLTCCCCATGRIFMTGRVSL